MTPAPDPASLAVDRAGLPAGGQGPDPGAGSLASLVGPVLELGQALEEAWALSRPWPAEWAGFFLPERWAEAPARALADCWEADRPTDPLAPARRFFALQTAYALTVKLFAAQALAAPSFAGADDAALSDWLARLESGALMREQGLTQLVEPDVYAGCAAQVRRSAAVASAVRALLAALAAEAGRGVSLREGDGEAAQGARDRFRALYQGLMPGAVRHALGEFYTPRWLAQAVLAEVPAPPHWRGLDPCCGSGTFLMELLAEALAETAGQPAGARLAALTDRVQGLDVHPLAVLAARVNYFSALAPLWRAAGQPAWRLPVFQGEATRAREPAGHFERVVGNPPWVSWKDAPASLRGGLAAEGAARGLLGGGRDAYAGGTDLNVCALIAHAALERWVAPAGALGFLMPRSILQVRSAQAFRRGRLPGGGTYALSALSDFSALKPFDAVCEPVLYRFHRGEHGAAAVPLRRYALAAGKRPAAEATWAELKPRLAEAALAAAPFEGEGGAYALASAEELASWRALFGPCAYRGRRATETSPHGVYWLRPCAPVAEGTATLRLENALNARSRDGIARAEVSLEPTLLYPLLRGRAIRAFGVEPTACWVLLPHAPATGAKALAPEALPPLTRSYLEAYAPLLRARGSWREYRPGEPFYSLWRVGPYTFAPYKVVWPEMGALRAAVIGTERTPWGESKLVIPEGKTNLIPCETAEEAHYVCALLNAPRLGRAYEALTSQIGRPSRLPFALARYAPERFSHRALAAVSRAAHAGTLEEARRERLLDWLLTRALPPDPVER